MPTPTPAPLHYAYRHTVTEATTGYFACEPEPALTFDAALQRLEAAPMDEFLHRWLLRELGTRPLEALKALTAQGEARPVLRALLLECALLNEDLAGLRQCFGEDAVQDSLSFTPLPCLRWSLEPERGLHQAWSALFAANITGHHKLPHPEEEELPPLYSAAEWGQAAGEGAVSGLEAVYQRLRAVPAPAWQRPPAQETALRALELLVENGIIAGVEMRHEASLSPIALLRQWEVDIKVRCGALDYSLRGTATTYGRGLSVADARASYAMEMVERASSYASVEGGQGLCRVTGLSRSTPLFWGSVSALRAEGHGVLDPHVLPLDAPYADQSLYWMEATEAGSGTSVLVPAQSVYLFCNLDEVNLCMNPGSTGLASGNTLAEAKVAALTEILERDAEATMPYDRSRCFTLRSRDVRVQGLLDDYAARGIHVQFLDLTTEFGVPCYQAFVMGQKGEICRATGAGLCGQRAALSALTEVPWAYPGGPASGPALRGLPERVLEDLPDYSLESPTRNVQLLEEVLLAHGRRPLYVELTREDLEFPVVRALVPGLELSPELDAFSRTPLRLYRNYMGLFA